MDKLIVKLSGKNIYQHPFLIARALSGLCQKVKLGVVHGGGPQISETMEKFGKKPTFVRGLRVTDEEDMEITEMVLSGLINKYLVGILLREGVLACGISGKDGFLFQGEKHLPEEENIDLGRVGEIRQVNTRLIEVLWEGGFLPVVSPISADKEGRSLNVNADWAAAWLALATQAQGLFLFSDVPGVLADPTDPQSLIEELAISQIPRLLEEDKIKEGMIPKLKMIEQVIRGGVGSVFIGHIREIEKLPQLSLDTTLFGTTVVDG